MAGRPRRFTAVEASNLLVSFGLDEAHSSGSEFSTTDASDSVSYR